MPPCATAHNISYSMAEGWKRKLQSSEQPFWLNYPVLLYCQRADKWTSKCPVSRHTGRVTGRKLQQNTCGKQTNMVKHVTIIPRVLSDSRKHVTIFPWAFRSIVRAGLRACTLSHHKHACMLDQTRFETILSTYCKQKSNKSFQQIKLELN